MKKVIFIIIIFLNLGCNVKEKKITELLIKKVDLDIDTAVRINCSDFESAFKKSIKLYKISDQTILKKLEIVLETLSKTDETENMDVRKKIIIFYSDDSKETLCLDRFGVMLDGNSMKIDNQSLQFMHNL